MSEKRTYMAEEYDRLRTAIAAGSGDMPLSFEDGRAALFGALRIAANVMRPGLIEGVSKAWFAKVHDNCDNGKFSGDEPIAAAIRKALLGEAEDAHG